MIQATLRSLSQSRSIHARRMPLQQLCSELVCHCRLIFAVPQPGQAFFKFPDLLQRREDTVHTPPVTPAYFRHWEHTQPRRERFTYPGGEAHRGYGLVGMLDK